MHKSARIAQAALSCFGELSLDALGLDQSADGKIASLASHNLSVLAGMMKPCEMIVCHGLLCSDGRPVASGAARADGKLVLGLAPGFEPDAAEWEFALAGQEEVRFRVTMIAGELGDDATWIIQDAEGFYEWLVGEKRPESEPVQRPGVCM